MSIAIDKIEQIKKNEIVRHALAFKAINDISKQLLLAKKDDKETNLITDDRADFQISQLPNLNEIAKHAVLIERTFHQILTNPDSPQLGESLGLLNKSLREQQSKILEYERQDKIKDCLKELTKQNIKMRSDYEEIKNSYDKDCKKRKLQQEVAATEQKSINNYALNTTPSSRTQKIIKSKWKKYLLYGAGISIGIVSLALCIAYPPALGCAAIVGSGYGAGIADGLFGTVFGIKDTKGDFKEDQELYDTSISIKKTFSDLLRDRIEKQSTLEGRILSSGEPDQLQIHDAISPSDETIKIIQSFGSTTMDKAQKGIELSIQSLAKAAEEASATNKEASDNTREVIETCTDLLSLSNKIENLNKSLIDLLKEDIESEYDHISDGAKRKHINNKLNTVTKELKLSIKKINDSSIPPNEKVKMQKIIKEDIKNISEINDSFRLYVGLQKGTKNLHVASIKQKIKNHKKSKWISWVGGAVAITALALACACPPVGAAVAATAIALFAGQLLVGAIGTSMAIKDLRSTQKAKKENKEDLEKAVAEKEVLKDIQSDAYDRFNQLNEMQEQAEQQEIEDMKSEMRGFEESSPAEKHNEDSVAPEQLNDVDDIRSPHSSPAQIVGDELDGILSEQEPKNYCEKTGEILETGNKDCHDQEHSIEVIEKPKLHSAPATLESPKNQTNNRLE